MAAAIMHQRYGNFVYVESAGTRAGELDPFAVETMEEIGIEIGQYRPKRFEDLEGAAFDLIVTLSPEAHHKAMELTRTSAATVEYWPTADPTAVEASREQRLDAYRAVRDELLRRIALRFAADRAAD
jgi:protein-tyrosine-phosphatase